VTGTQDGAASTGFTGAIAAGNGTTVAARDVSGVGRSSSVTITPGPDLVLIRRPARSSNTIPPAIPLAVGRRVRRAHRIRPAPTAPCTTISIAAPVFAIPKSGKRSKRQLIAIPASAAPALSRIRSIPRVVSI
jgi:hypothetical protein